MPFFRRIFISAAAALALILVTASLLMFLLPHSATALPDCSEDIGLLFAENAHPLDVLAVIDHSPASRSGIQPGDRISSVNGRSVTSIEELDTIIQESTESSGHLSVTVMRGLQQIDLTLHLKKSCLAALF